MGNDSGMALGIGIVMLLLLTTPIVLVVWLVRRAARAGRIPPWTVWASVPLAIALGVLLTFFVVFDDLGRTYLASRAAPTVALHLPPAFRGTVYVFFDSTQPPLASRGGQRYDIPVPTTGKVLTGFFPGIRDQIGFVNFRLTYPDSSVAPQVPLPSGGGMFDAVIFSRFFVGDENDARLDQANRTMEGTVYDEDFVYKELKAAAAAGAQRP